MNEADLARISHQAASRRQNSSWFQEVDRDTNDRAGCRLRWPCPRGSFGPVYTRAVRAHAPSTVDHAMLSVASTRTCPCVHGAKSSAIITAPGEKCRLARHTRAMLCKTAPSPTIDDADSPARRPDPAPRPPIAVLRRALRALAVDPAAPPAVALPGASSPAGPVVPLIEQALAGSALVRTAAIALILASAAAPFLKGLVAGLALAGAAATISDVLGAGRL